MERELTLKDLQNIEKIFSKLVTTVQIANDCNYEYAISVLDENYNFSEVAFRLTRAVSDIENGFGGQEKTEITITY